MGYITPDLAKIMRARILNPVIVEFTTTEKMKELLTTLESYISVAALKIGTPSPFREARSLQNRVASRFQNPLLTLKKLDTFKMVALPLNRRAIEEVATWPEVTKIYRNRLHWAFSAPPFPTTPPDTIYQSPIKVVFTTIMHTRKLMGANQAHASGWRGEGIIACTIDTGGSVIHEQTREMEYYSAMKDKGQFKDKNGHGQHVMSTIGGRLTHDRSLNVDLEGVAPLIHQIGVKALGFVIGAGFTSDVIEGLQYALNRKVDVVNMSLGSEGIPPTPEDDAEIIAINKLVDAGILVCVAAGNSGPDPETISTPGCAPSCLSVGSYSPFTGLVNEFSSRGPVKWDDETQEIKPDVVAPGDGIYTGCLGLLDPVGDGLTNRNAVLSGTSMATPHVAGLLALAKQYYRSLGVELTVELVKTICSDHNPTKSSDYGYGAIHWSWFTDYAQKTFA